MTFVKPGQFVYRVNVTNKLILRFDDLLVVLMGDPKKPALVLETKNFTEIFVTNSNQDSYIKNGCSRKKNNHFLHQKNGPKFVYVNSQEPEVVSTTQKQ